MSHSTVFAVFVAVPTASAVVVLAVIAVVVARVAAAVAAVVGPTAASHPASVVSVVAFVFAPMRHPAWEDGSQHFAPFSSPATIHWGHGQTCLDSLLPPKLQVAVEVVPGSCLGTLTGGPWRHRTSSVVDRPP